MCEVQLKDTFLVIFILDMDKKPNVVEFFILGPSMARQALTRVVRQSVVGSAITTTTPESRTDWYMETCMGISERKRSQLLSRSPESGLHLSSCALLNVIVLFSIFASRQRIAMNATVRCTDNPSPDAHAHFFLFRTSHVTARVAQGMMSLCESSHKSFLHLSCHCWVFSSTRFPLVLPSTSTSQTTPATSAALSTGIRLNPCATPLGDGLSGRLAGPIPNTQRKFIGIDDVEQAQAELGPQENMMVSDSSGCWDVQRKGRFRHWR